MQVYTQNDFVEQSMLENNSSEDQRTYWKKQYILFIKGTTGPVMHDTTLVNMTAAQNQGQSFEGGKNDG